MQKHRGGRSGQPPRRFVERRISNLTDKFDGDTQRLRSQLIIELKALQEVAVQQTQSVPGRKATDQQNWVRIATYISQVINGIAKTYDVAQIKAELEELKRTVGELEQK